MKMKVSKTKSDRTSSAFQPLVIADWLRLWIQVAHELRAGARLRHVAREHAARAGFTLTTYDTTPQTTPTATNAPSLTPLTNRKKRSKSLEKTELQCPTDGRRRSLARMAVQEIKEIVIPLFMSTNIWTMISRLGFEMDCCLDLRGRHWTSIHVECAAIRLKTYKETKTPTATRVDPKFGRSTPGITHRPAKHGTRLWLTRGGANRPRTSTSSVPKCSRSSCQVH